MPLTARLSKQFYDKFGNAVVDELVNWFNQIDTTHKSELRELNALNWARLESRLLAHISNAEGRMARLIVALWLATMGTVVALLKL